MISETLRKGWIDHLNRERYGPRPKREYVWASSRRTCVRQMALDLSNPEDEEMPDPAGLERMTRGSEREMAVVARLMQIGPRCDPPFEVIEGQRRFEIKDRDGALLMTGRIDGRIKIGGRRPVFEVKSGRSFERATCLEDLDRGTWTRHTVDQILAYLYDAEEEEGLLILETAGLPTFLPVYLEPNLGRVESFLQDARVAIEAAKGNCPLPDYISTPDDCRRCPHLGKSCMPQIDYGAGAKVIVDEVLEAAAKMREVAATAAKSYRDADALLKRRLRGVTCAILGDFTVTGKWEKRGSNPKGAFKLNVQRSIVPSETEVASGS
jgi:hypothetical protein